MGNPGERKKQKIPLFASLQMKYAMSYLAILTVVLILLNTYPLIASQELLFTSKRDSLKSQASVMASALMELETLSSDQVVRVMNMLNSMGLARVIVTDPAGLILYDSTKLETTIPAEAQSLVQEGEREYRYGLYQEIVVALRGYDVFYSSYANRVFTSSAAMPIMYRGMVIGAIYLREIDQDQGALLTSLQQNLRTISLVIAILSLVMSAFFSQILTARIAALLRAIRVVGEGEYAHRLHPVGRDEMAQLAEEFNQLTDRLQTTEEVRRRFVSDASHELKTPLASIRLLTDSILQNRKMPLGTMREFVFDIGNEAERLTRITEHLLSLTRLDSLPGGETVPVEVSAVVEQAVNMLEPVAEAAGVTLHQSCKPGCVIQCRQDDLYSIAFNLIENAIKYNYSGGHVFVSVHQDEEQVFLEVEDTGIGIPEEDLTKVFNRFYRVDKARSRAAGGTGLGLSIVRDTVRRHGGWVTASRRQPEGSSFSVGFPRDYPSEEEVVP